MESVATTATTAQTPSSGSSSVEYVNQDSAASTYVVTPHPPTKR